MATVVEPAIGGSPRPVDQRIKGIFCLTVGIAVFSVQDVIIKLLSGEYPVHQAMVIRSLTALPLLFLLVVLDGGVRSLNSKRRGLLIVRGLGAQGSASGADGAAARGPGGDGHKG